VTSVVSRATTGLFVANASWTSGWTSRGACRFSEGLSCGQVGSLLLDLCERHRYGGNGNLNIGKPVSGTDEELGRARYS
jgi:hypothetical protein